MRKFFFLILLVSFISCGDDNEKETSTLNVEFKLTYDGIPLTMFTNYTYPTGEVFYFSRFSFFTSDVQLKNENGNYIDILDVKYNDLTNSHTPPGSTYNFNVDNIKNGQYTAIKMGIGVPSAANAKSPADYNADHPLSNQSEYWGGWVSYIFTRTEGNIDFDGNGIPETGFALHTGADNAYRTIEFPANITISPDKKAVITIEIDLKKEFGVNPIYNIRQNPQIHSLTQQPQVLELIDNLVEGFSIK